jgi:hypothetical protein
VLVLALCALTVAVGAVLGPNRDHRTFAPVAAGETPVVQAAPPADPPVAVAPASSTSVVAVAAVVPPSTSAPPAADPRVTSAPATAAPSPRDPPPPPPETDPPAAIEAPLAIAAASSPTPSWPAPPFPPHWCGVPDALADAWARLPEQIRVEIEAWGVCIHFESIATFATRFGLDASDHDGAALAVFGDVAVSPRVPAGRRFDVLAHELAHTSPGLAERWIDGTVAGTAGEVAADERACGWGATLVHYIGSC